MYSVPDLVSEFNCSLCHVPFDDKPERLPRLLPDCGHTFCSQCIADLLAKTPESEPFQCPEDQIESSISKKDITFFPKNFALLKLIEKKRVLAMTVSKGNHETESPKIGQSEKNTSLEKTIIREKSSLKQVVLSRKSSEKAIIPKESPLTMREEPKEAVGPVQATNTSTMPARSRLCPDHQRKLEVVCIDHQTRICTNCALFGFHKNHNIKPEDDVLLEITTRAESLLNLFQEIDSNQKYLDSAQFFDFYSSKIKDKELELYHALNSKFEDLIEKIRNQQEKLIQDLQEKFKDLGQRFKILSGSQRDLTDKIGSWKSL